MQKVVKIMCKKPGMKFRHYGKPSFEVRIDDEPIEVMQEVAEFLLLDKPGMVYAVNDKGEEIEYKDFEVIDAKAFRAARQKVLDDLNKDNVKDPIDERLKDIEKDLKDDGKLNYSHDPSRKSPGRKSKKEAKK